MNDNRTKRCDVIVNGRRSGAVDRWKHIRLTIHSPWDIGSDPEKLLVLAAIRRIYNPEDRTGMGGKEGQTPAQIGRCEGFRELEYQHVAAPSTPIVIVPPLLRYLRVPPAADRMAGVNRSEAALDERLYDGQPDPHVKGVQRLAR
jgi:hypothetical protein